MKNHEADALARFQGNTKNHSLEILRDDGLYRHLKFSKGGSSVYRFDLVTWPGYLAVSGDMGEYVFTRLADMFEFFRSEKGGISPSYWAEKCRAADPREGLKTFDEETARAGVKGRITEFYEDAPSRAADAITEVMGEIQFYDGEIRFIDSCRDFEGPDRTYPFEDCESIPDPMVWSFHYLWICHAIVWGIQQYDKTKAEQVAA